MKSVNLIKMSCSWCDAPASERIVENGWVDFACLEHGRKHFPGEYADSDRKCATSSCWRPAEREIMYPGLDGQSVRESVCQPCASAYLAADPYVSLVATEVAR